MSDILHAWALAPAAIGTCCLAAERRRVRVPEIVASLLMLAAMIDASRPAPLVAPVYWAALMIVAGMVLAMLRRARGHGALPIDRPTATARVMTLHTGIGMITMGALLLTMGRVDAGASGHTHGMSAGALSAVLLAGVAAFAVGSLVAAARAHGLLDRVQFVAMGASTSVMGLALLG